MSKKRSRLQIVGKTVQVIDSPNKQIIGINGKIIDETKNTISLEKNQKIKIIIKDKITLMINNKEEQHIQGRAEERLKTYR